jgi:hypothetical protein
MDKAFARLSAKFLLNDMVGLCRQYGCGVESSGIRPVEFGIVMACLYRGLIDRKRARDIFRTRLGKMYG